MNATAQPQVQAPASTAAETPKAPLDDVMLAMDVVDTLRHRQDLVTRELDAETREKQLIAKLREIYHDQGIEVPDSVLKEGVDALKESRFVYTPPKPSLKTTLARFYVSRRKWGPAALALFLILVIGLGGYFLAYKPFQQGQAEAARIELAEKLPEQMDRVVNREGMQSGFWTFPEINTAATNYYVVVEALDPEGKALSLPVLNEENGETETVAIWGVRVPESVLRSIEADKRDDGIIQRNIIGIKQYGFLDVDYAVPVLGGAVTRW